MRLVRLFAALVAAFAFGGLAVGTAAGAATAEDCQAQLATLRSDTAAAETSFTNANSVTGLVGKLDAASTKLADGKNADAVDKLGDFQTTLNALATAPKPKVDATTAQALTAEAQGVTDCVAAIGTA